MSQPKMLLQDAEETFSFSVKLIEVDWLEHKSISAGLQDFPFFVRLSTDGDDGSFIRGIGFDAAADFDSVYAGDHDVENQQIRFSASDFEQRRDAVGGRGNLVGGLALQERFYQADNLGFVVDDQNSEFPIDQGSWSWYL